MLEARGIGLILAGRRVLSEVSLGVAPGEIVAVIGPNGAGKSSLLGCLSGALRPSSGRVLIDGRGPESLAPRELAIRRSVLEQTPLAAAPFRLEDLVALGIAPAVPPAEARRITLRALGQVGLEDYRSRPITQLSGGERHRAHMARALAQLWSGRALGGGGWLLLDEPTASLDLAHQKSVLDAARAAAAEGTGVVVVLHDLTLAAAVADRVVLMRAGEIAAEGAPRAVLTAERLAPVYGLELLVSEPAPGALAVTPIMQANRKGADRCSSP